MAVLRGPVGLEGGRPAQLAPDVAQVDVGPAEAQAAEAGALVAPDPALAVAAGADPAVTGVSVLVPLEVQAHRLLERVEVALPLAPDPLGDAVTLGAQRLVRQVPVHPAGAADLAGL